MGRLDAPFYSGGSSVLKLFLPVDAEALNAVAGVLIGKRTKYRSEIRQIAMKVGGVSLVLPGLLPAAHDQVVSHRQNSSVVHCAKI